MGRILVVEFDEQDASAFEEIMGVLRRHPAFERLWEAAVPQATQY